LRAFVTFSAFRRYWRVAEEPISPAADSHLIQCNC
jgi:hypothetical protein